MPRWSSFSAFLDEIAASDSDRQALVDQLLQERPDWPWVESSQATFVYTREGAHSVALNLDTIPHDPPFAPMQQVEGTTLWYVTHSFQTDDLLDYMLAVDDPMTPLAQEKNIVERVSAHWQPDPLNPLHMDTMPMNVSVLRMNGARPFPNWSVLRAVPRGRVYEHLVDSDAMNYHGRKLWVYTPPGYDGSGMAYPLLIVQDGQWAVGPLQLPYVADALIKHRRMLPAVIAMMQSGNQDERNQEYINNDRYYTFILSELMPFVQTHYRIDSESSRGRRCGGRRDCGSARRAPQSGGVLPPDADLAAAGQGAVSGRAAPIQPALRRRRRAAQADFPVGRALRGEGAFSQSRARAANHPRRLRVGRVPVRRDRQRAWTGRLPQRAAGGASVDLPRRSVRVKRLLLALPPLALMVWLVIAQLPRWTAPGADWFAADTPGVCAAVELLALYGGTRDAAGGIGSAAAKTDAAQVAAQYYDAPALALSDPLAVQAALPGESRRALYVVTVKLSDDSPAQAAVIYLDAANGDPLALITATDDPAADCQFDVKAALIAALKSPPPLLLVAYLVMLAALGLARRIAKGRHR